MIKIISSGKGKKFRAKCRCGCEFEYEAEDRKNLMCQGQVLSSCVLCPECRAQVYDFQTVSDTIPNCGQSKIDIVEEFATDLEKELEKTYQLCYDRPPDKTAMLAYVVVIDTINCLLRRYEQ